MTDRERWVQPLDGHDPDRRATGVTAPGHPLLDRPEPFPERLDQVDGGILDLRHRADGGDRVEDALDGGRLERHDGDIGVDPAGDLVDLPIADRAHVAQLLGEDQVRLDGRERLLVELIERGTAVHRCGDASVDLA